MRVFAAKYDGATEGVGKVIVVVLVPLYALLFQALYARSPRFFAEHLVLATHVIAFLLVATAATGITAGLIAALARGLGFGMPAGEFAYSTFLVSVFGAYVYNAQRVVYGATRGGALVRTVVLTMSIVPTIIAFKFVLFFVTLYWIS